MSVKNKRHIIGITLGDPAGIGPEVLAGYLASGGLPAGIPFVLYGPSACVQRGFTYIRAPFRLPDNLTVCDTGGSGDDFPPGREDRHGGEAALNAIDRAISDIRAGHLSAVVTLPVSKRAVSLTLPSFTGHTEYFAEAFGVREFFMVLSGERVRAALMTTHVPLRDVPDLISGERIVACGRLFNPMLQAITEKAQPRIAVCGLNPHAGEKGLLGVEDEEIIRPAAARLRELAIQADGPLPACSLFSRIMNGEFDGAIAMYHDQGLIPVKMEAFGRGVNTTIGLPFVRTSVDHGTAFDIAGKGTAGYGSLSAAVRMAALLLNT